jgi:lipopolysaccharide biosynthesis glycosyltransferase
MTPNRIFVGFDQREAVAYHTFCQSVISRATVPVAFVPLAKKPLSGIFDREGGSNDFTYSRFLVPYLCDFKGWALFCDGDMVVNEDIAALFARADPTKAVMVVKHQYKTKHPVKYLGAKNEDYPCKNWSSVILWNCEHPANRALTPSTVKTLSPAMLHRFWWIQSGSIGDLPKTWNWLVSEYDRNDDANLHHYTIGTPCFSEYADCDNADRWHAAHQEMTHADQR